MPTLEALIAAGHDVVCVYSQPPRPAGRGHKLHNSAVHEAALQHGIEVRTPISLKGSDAQEAFGALDVDLAVVVAYGLLLPKAVLEAPRLGCLNLHGSLLPRWRGAAPLQRAIMAGDLESGVMIMRMEEGLDTGPVLATLRMPINDSTTTGELQVALSREGAKLMAQTIERLAQGPIEEQVQSGDGITYAKKIAIEEAHINWARPAREVLRHIHGLNPAPGAWSLLNETRVKILRVRLMVGQGAAGHVVGMPLIVACADGALQIIELQRAGRGLQTAEEFVRGFPVVIGTRFI